MSNSTYLAEELPPHENYSSTTCNLLDNLLDFDHNFDASVDEFPGEEDGFQPHLAKTQFGSCSSEENPLPTSFPDEKIEEKYSLVTLSGEGSSWTASPTSYLPIEGEIWEKTKKKDGVLRVAFRTKSAVEIMDDGFKWRKYGKKKVKNSPNPRNYYRCASVGCEVKKRVQRDSEDASYVLTTYEGTHNHQSPCVLYYNQTPLLVPTGWTLQASNDA